MSEVLQRIDQALAGWEESPEAWRPGDPIHPHPSCCGPGGQTVRPMVEVIDEESWWLADDRCEPCHVSWVGPEPCWMCGTDRPDRFARSDPADRALLSISSSFDTTIELAIDTSAFEAALRRVADTVARLDFPVSRTGRAQVRRRHHQPHFACAVG